MKIKAVIFDWGGVLMRWRRYFEDFTEKKGIDLDEFEKAFWKYAADPELGKISVDEFHKRSLKELGREELWQEMRAGVPQEFEPIKETMELIEEIKNNFRLGILSNTQADILHEWLDLYLPDESFEVVIDSSIEKVRKPDKEIYELAYQRLKLKPEECLFVDDLVENIEAAKKVGMEGVHFEEVGKGIKEIKEKLGLV